MDNNGEVVYLYLDDIIPNRFQPREVFDDQALKELAVSIKEHGVIQPIIVRKVENKYEIIAGERRYKASTMAGLTKIPAIVKDLDDKESSKVALIENLQRKDLTPIEEARTYQKILELEDGMTQEQLAATMGKTQSSVSNKLRLLDLPDEIQDALLKEKISERHARSLLSIEDKNDQIKMMDKVIAEKMTVRELDKEIKMMNGEPQDSIQETPSNIESIPSITPSIGLNTVEQTNNDIQTESTNTQESTVADITPVSNVEPVQEENNKSSNINEEPKTEAPQLATFNNPTSVDIDKIRESSTDIGSITQNAQPTVANNQEQTNDEFKFVPTFGDALDSNSTVTEVTEAPQKPMFDQFFSANTDNNSVASSISTSGISVPAATPVKDITQAITDVKTAITNLQNGGYNIKFEEADSVDNYKITIQIDKN